MHEGYERETQAHFRFLKAQDKGSPEALAKLRRQSLAVLAVYVEEVEWLKVEEGQKWSPLNPQLYAEAKAYLVGNPLQKKAVE